MKKILLMKGTPVNLYHEDSKGELHKVTQISSIKDIEFSERELSFMFGNINVYIYRKPYPIFDTKEQIITINEIRWRDDT